jgi:Arc/MetJ-type ribon-helix-helix transcriptional regulator
MAESKAAEPSNGRTRFTVRISDRLADYLEAAVKLGLYGSSSAEVARKFIENEAERLIREGLIKITPPEA